MSDMLKEVAQAKSQAISQAKGEEVLPAGAAPLEAAEIPQVFQEAAPQEVEVPEEAPAPQEKIQIGDQVFDSHEAAFKYAQKLENDRLISDAYNQGIREALAQTQPPPVAPPEEDNFDEKFYSNPKQALAEVEERAEKRVLGKIEAERQKEALWKAFEEKYPDVERTDAELVLARNMDTVGKMTDIDKAMEVLARKTRAEYQRIVEKFKPRTELPPSRGQAVVPSGAQVQKVTSDKKEEAPLTMAQQMRNLREQKRNSPA